MYICTCIHTGQLSFLTFAGEFGICTLKEVGLAFLCHLSMGELTEHHTAGWGEATLFLFPVSEAIPSGSCRHNNAAVATILEALTTLRSAAAAALRDPP